MDEITFSKEFKIKACELVLKDGIKHKVVAEKLGIHYVILYNTGGSLSIVGVKS